MRNPSLATILADPNGTPLTVGRETATELGIEALEHLEGTPSDADLHALVAYALRHEEASPCRDALIAVVFDASGTLAALQDRAMQAYHAIVGAGASAERTHADTAPFAVPRRQALAERLLAERARRLRPRMHAVASAILAGGARAAPVPGWFLERNWLDLRDTLSQRARNEPAHRMAIARWLEAQPPAVQARLRAVEETLVELAIQAILQTPERAPLEPYCGHERVAERVRSAVNFRGEPARVRLRGYLGRLAQGTPWYETIASIAAPVGDGSQSVW